MQSVTEQIKERLGIVDVVGGYLKLEKAGINYKAKCPFHNEKTPSFFVSPSRQSFYCFGCGEKGDIFSFVEKFEGVDFKTALETLAERAGVKLEKFRGENKEDSAGKKEKEIIYEAVEKACVIFEENLKQHKEALGYLAKRGVDEKIIKKWRLGFAKDEWRDIYDKLIKDFDKKILEKAGLIKEKDGKNYDTFRGRIIFPISDSSGKVIAFSGRSFPDKEGSPKYLNSPETPIFHKSEALYGWHIAKNTMRKIDYAVLVEGQMDLVLSHRAGVLNTVASSGTALTESHLQKIKKLTNRVIIAYDSDSAGENAAERASKLALSLGMEVKIAELAEGEDPASLILKDEGAWKIALREAKHLIDFCLHKVGRDKKGTALMKEIERSVLPYFQFIKSEIERSHFVRKIADKIGVSEEAVLKEIAKTKTESEKIFGTKQKTATSPERMLAGIILVQNASELENKWREIAGSREVENILNELRPEKEALIFEAEEMGVSGEEVLDRIELKILKDRLRECTQDLDKLKGEADKDIKEKIDKISKRIHQLSKNNQS